jgi:hypothetical protein
MQRAYVSLPKGNMFDDEWEGLRDFVAFTTEEHGGLLRRIEDSDDRYVLIVDIEDGVFEPLTMALREAVNGYAGIRSIRPKPTITMSKTDPRIQ